MTRPLKFRYSVYSSLIILLVLTLFAVIFCPNFVTSFNASVMLKQVSHITLMAYGATVVIMLGHINVAYGSVMALTGCVACQVMNDTGNMFAAGLSAVILGMMIGFFMGKIITQFEIPSFIVTLVVGMIARGAALVYTDSAPILQIGELSVIGQGVVLNIPVPVYIMALCFLITWFTLNKTAFGRQVIAVGENREAARASGIRVAQTVIKGYVLDGFFTAVAAIVYMARMNSGLPDSGNSSEFDVITAVVIGGTSLTGGVGSITGTLIGAIVVGIINNVLNLWSINYNWQSIIKGIVILSVIIFDYGFKKKQK
ncbi:MAG: ABC transporter permease [Ruminococcus sp.]|jgi:inositol transport system permease protein